MFPYLLILCLAYVEGLQHVEELQHVEGLQHLEGLTARVPPQRNSCFYTSG